ncbi:MAG: phospholipase [Flavobacteriales bacterium]|nr:MAG: phospholipase [Flavobacteriales bacterium]
MSDLIHEYRDGDHQNSPIILMLHGYGSHENDLFSFADELPKNFPIVSARAPHALGFGGYCWYQINFEATDPSLRSDDKMAIDSRDRIIAFIERLKVKYNNPHKVILLGFSQGCILSYSVAFTRPDLVSSVMALSGYLHQPILPEKVKHQELKHLDFYVAHGKEDPIIPIEWARKSVTFLETNKLNHQYREYNVGHGIDAQGFHDLKNYLQKIAER